MNMKVNVKDYSNGDIMRFLREYVGLTQQELADRLKRNIRTIQRYEKEDIKIDLDLIRELCEISDLNLTIESKRKQKESK